MSFNPSAIDSFSFLECDFSPHSGTASLHYALDDRYFFCERYTFAGAPFSLDAKRRSALNRALNLLHLAAGVSYYKAAVPKRIVLSAPISEGDAAFLDRLYSSGLGEFSYRNKLDLRDRIRFPYVNSVQTAPESFNLKRQSAVLIGGGKDSLVTIEALKAGREPMMLLSLAANSIINDAAALSGQLHINITRQIDPRLMELNREGAYNGHVPISAIIACAAAVAAILYDFDAIIVSNERSANHGNLFYLGEEINHQFSKSYEFEQSFNALIQKRVHPNLNYFSFLRPLSELGIARLFCRSITYDQVFTSCNAAFKLKPKLEKKRWCGECPKCLFVYLVLAPFMEPERLRRIFGEDLLSREYLAEGFDALCGFGTHKPFECVGEPEEAQAAFLMLGADRKWKNSTLVRRFKEEHQNCIFAPAALIDRVLAFSDKHALGPHSLDMLNSYIDSK